MKGRQDTIRGKGKRILAGILCAALMLSEPGIVMAAEDLFTAPAESESVTEEAAAGDLFTSGEEEQDLFMAPEEKMPKEERAESASYEAAEAEEAAKKDMTALTAEQSFLKMYTSIFGVEYTEEATQILYVAGEAPAESSFSKGTKENPYTSISDAYANSSKNLIIYLQGDYTAGGVTYQGYREDVSLETGWVASGKPAIITAEEGIGLPMYTSWSFGGNTGLYDLSIRLKYPADQNEEIFCDGHTVVLGGEGQNNLQMSLEGATYYPTLFGGSRSNTVEQTNLTVNGGTYGRIYSGGSYGSVVTGAANLTVNGSVTGAADLCSVILQTNAGLAGEYKETETLVGSKVDGQIVGGGATNHNGAYGAVGSANLRIHSLHKNGKLAYRATVNGGNVTAGDASLTITDSKLQDVHRGCGETAGDLHFQVAASEVKNLHLIQKYSGPGLNNDAEITVKCTDSKVEYFWGRQSNSSGSVEGTKTGISQTLEFVNCDFKELYMTGNYNGKGGADSCVVDNCRFETGGYFVGTGNPKTVDLEFRNMSQKLIFCKDSQEAKNQTVAGSTLGVYQWDQDTNREVSIALVHSEAEMNVDNGNWNGLRLENSTISVRNLSLGNIAGSGTIRMADNCTGNFAGVGEGTRIAFGSWGEVKNKCTIVANHQSQNGEEFYQEEGNQLHYRAVPGRAISFWYLSAEEMPDDSANSIYVDQTAQPGGSGTFAQPFSTLEEAYEALTPERNQIVLMSQYVLKGDFPKAEQMGETSVVITARDSVNDFSQYAFLLIENEKNSTGGFVQKKVNLHNNTIFRNVEIAPLLPDTKTDVVQLYANGYQMEMQEGATGRTLISLFGGNSSEQPVDRAALKVHAGHWYRIGLAGGNVGSPEMLPAGNVSEDPAKNVNENVIAAIDIKNADFGNIYLLGNVYGSVEITVDGIRKITNSQMNLGGTIYGNMSVDILGNSGWNSYGDYIHGTYYGKMTYSTLKAEYYGFYYSVSLEGTYYQGAEVLLGKGTTFRGTGGINLVGQNGLTAYAPIVYDVEPGADVSGVYAAVTKDGKGKEKAKFFDTGCIQLNIPQARYITTAESRDKAYEYRPEYYEKFHLTIKAQEGAAASVVNCYGFETVTVEQGADVMVESPLNTRELVLKEGAKFAGRGTLTIGAPEAQNGLLSLESGARADLQQPVYVNGDALGGKNGPAILALNNELYTDDGENTPGSYSYISGKTEGQIGLFTNLPYREESSQKLYVKDKTAEAVFVPFQEGVTLKKEETQDYLVCRFGNTIDYSVIYVDGEGGDDNQEGLDREQAVKTLHRAYELVTNGGTIVICGSVKVDEWPENAIRSATITSCNFSSETDPADYRVTNEATLTLPPTMSLKADTVFACLDVKRSDSRSAINAAGYKLTFGVEEEKLPDGVANFSCESIYSVYGTDSTYAYPTSITIHSGTFFRVDPWTDDQRKEMGIPGTDMISVVMTGGTVDRMGVGNYTRPVGNGRFLLTGGKVKQLGSSSLTTYAHKDYNEFYEIRDEFTYDKFYTTQSSVATGNVTVRMTDVQTILPMFCYGNEMDGMIRGDAALYLENTTIQDVYGGKSSASASAENSGAVEIHLGENAKIENLYCGSQGTVENEKEIKVHLEAAGASVGNLYPYGLSGALRIPDIQLLVTNQRKEGEFLSVDFLRGGIDLLQVGDEETSGRVSIGREAAGYIGHLRVNGGSMAEVTSGSVFAGDYESQGTKDNPAILQTTNGASIQFQGTISGYTKLTTESTQGFKNGVTITGEGTSEEESPDEMFEIEDGELVYDEEKNEWSVPDSEDNAERNTVYVSMNGNDEAAGARGTPVQTIGKAYERAGELYTAIQENPDISEEKKQELLANMQICILDRARVGTITENQTEGFEHVTVFGEEKEACIELADENPEFAIPMSTTFKDMMFDDRCSRTDPAIYAQGYSVCLEESVTTSHESAAGNRYIIIYGGAKEQEVASTHLTVLGGCFHSVYGGGYRGKVTGDVNLTVGKNIKVGTDITPEFNTAYSVYGGGRQEAALVGGNVNVTVEGGSYWSILGGGLNAPVSGDIRMDFQWGKTHALYGGGEEGTATANSTTVFIGKTGETQKAEITGLFRGSGLRAGMADETGTATVTVYENALIAEGTEFCAGGYSGSVGNTQLTIRGGEIHTDIYGGGWGTANSDEYGIISHNTHVSLEGGTIKGNVFAGGNNGLVQGQTQLDINGGSLNGNLYGGGNAAGVKESNVVLSLQPDAVPVGNVFGGSYRIERDSRNIQQNSEVIFNAGKLDGNLFGGSDTAGDIKQTAEVMVQGNVSVTGGIYGGGSRAPLSVPTNVVVDTNAVITGNVFGGGQGMADENEIETAALTDANVPDTKVTVKGKVIGNVYGGGELATVGNPSLAAAEAVTSVQVQDGAAVTGNVYGGGKGREGRDFAKIHGNTNVVVEGGTITKSSEAAKDGNVFGGGEIAPVQGETNVTVSGGTVTNIFGGNDRSGSISGNTNVTVTQVDGNASPTVENVYGGGRDAAYEGDEAESDKTTQVKIDGGTVTNAYGGGYGQTAVCKNTHLTISGGQTETAFAGGNAATVSGKPKLTVATGEGKSCVDTVFAGNNQAGMAVQPELSLVSGKIETLYGGGNEGDMTLEGGLSYENLGSDQIYIENLYGGCNQADVKGGVRLELTAGTYHNVYGGNNVSGQATASDLRLNGEALRITNAYGGGNKADIARSSVTALSGAIENLYGGGNEATVTENAKVAVGQLEASEDGQNHKTGTAEITNLYCGNNQASMYIAPETDLQKGSVTSFFGGGNQGAMEKADGGDIQLQYSFDSDGMKIDSVYGGGNLADVKGSVTLSFGGAKIGNAYGGCNQRGEVIKTNLYLRGNGVTNLFGGGFGKDTKVKTANVTAQNGTLLGNLYGGSGFGTVETSVVTVKEGEDADRILIEGSVFGGGYGESSVVENSQVLVDMKLDIAVDGESNSESADLVVTEAQAESASAEAAEEDSPSGETITKLEWKQQSVSQIKGSVYGGGDMGKVGDGHIKSSANTADIELVGNTHVQVKGGYINGSVFGGGSGTPAAALPYTAYMGTVFGSCEVEMNGGYVAGSVYGCGHQSRVYAPEDTLAALVDIVETPASEGNGSDKVIIGTSVFGGGNKGEGQNQNASVYTVIGDTQVNIRGIQGKETSTGIYFLSDSKGGVYGDGNLCLVNGRREVNLTDFHYGTKNKELLKTFYSLQRADEVNLTRSRVVLRGAKDLVDETADDTVYSVNRVGQLNMKESSALKMTTVVNLLGGLSSDQNYDTVYIDKGNNGRNSYTHRGGVKPENELTKEQIEEYREAYFHFLDPENGKDSNRYTSFNVISVANGSYLEIKKNDTEYGAVKGLFTLELLHANPGEGGGFVYADIGTKDQQGSTGDFICSTPSSTQEAQELTYMEVNDTVGGYSRSGAGTEGDYTYYYWLIKGGKYTYKPYLKGYIGTTETEFSTSVNLMELQEGYHYILNSVSGNPPVEDLNNSKAFCKTRLQDHWNEEEDSEKDAYAIELKVVPGGTGENLEEVSIGYLSYGPYGENKEECWGIKKSDGSVLTGTKDENTTVQELLKKNDVYGVRPGTTGLSLQFVLHKGNGVTVEFKDAPVNLTFDVLKATDNGDFDLGNVSDKAHLTVKSMTSITRLVPTQAAYISSGRLYAGVSSDIPTKITRNSAFTAQFITKFVPSAFNTSVHQIEEVLTTDCMELYLLDEVSGIGFTGVEDKEGSLILTYVTEGNLNDYTITGTMKDGFQVTYTESTEEEGEKEVTHSLTVSDTQRQSMALPPGTVITLVAQIDDYASTYWYYYCTDKGGTKEIPLKKFRPMNGGKDSPGYSFAAASGNRISQMTSNRVTENLTFVLDFSNVSEKTTEDYPGWSENKNVEGCLRLKHLTTIGSIQNADIMDYVSASTVIKEDGTSETSYTREYPAVSNTFDVTKERDGLKTFAIASSEERNYYTRDTYGIDITVEEDEDYINTQFEEREYAVVLRQTDETGEKVIPFPEGTLFRFQGNTLTAGNGNQSVIIPVKKAGDHHIEMETGLEAFREGTIHLKATLYSASVASYYNSLDTDVTATLNIPMKDRPEGLLQIRLQEREPGTEDAAHLFAPGERLELSVVSGGGLEKTGSVTLYRYDRETQTYEKIPMADVLNEGQETFAADTQGTKWSGAVKSEASPGTYRLEFAYEAKREYWDFIVK